jgi:hypothetical protein
VAGPDEGPAENPEGKAAFDLGRVNHYNLGVPAELFPVAAGGLGNFVGQGPAAVRVIPEKPRNHRFNSTICSG